MNAGHALQDWQTWVTLAVGVGALGYLLRRWWPGKTGSDAGRCSTGAGAHASTRSGGCGSCGGGCGGAPSTPLRDHRDNAPPASAVRWHPPRQAKH